MLRRDSHEVSYSSLMAAEVIIKADLRFGRTVLIRKGLQRSDIEGIDAMQLLSCQLELLSCQTQLYSICIPKNRIASDLQTSLLR